MRDYRLYLDDILEAARRIKRYTKGMRLEELKKNTLVIDGIVRNLEVIGEAAKRIPTTVKEKYREVEWKKLVDLGISWRTSTSALIWKSYGIL